MFYQDFGLFGHTVLKINILFISPKNSSVLKNNILIRKESAPDGKCIYKICWFFSLFSVFIEHTISEKWLMLGKLLHNGQFHGES